MSTWGSYATNNQQNNDSDLSSYADSDEEDLPPLQISSWGDNNVVARVNDQGTTEVNVSSNGWASLIDPNHKIAANGLGSGNLHRKGGNFKPVDEEYILNHRLKKGGPMPKAPGSGKKKKPAPAQGRGGGSFGRNPGPSPRQAYRPAPPPPSTRRPPPPQRPGDGMATGWGTQKLAETPFWEQPAAASAPATHAPPSPASTAGSANNWQGFSSGAAASKYATGAAASKYAPQQQQQQSAYNTPPPSGGNESRYAPQPSYSQQQAPASMGSSSSRYAPSQGADSATSMYAPQNTAQQQPMPTGSSSSQFRSGAAASKYATSNGSAASKYAPQNAGSNASIYAPPSASTPSPPSPPPQRQQQKPILTFNIELVPGVSAPLNVYENSNPLELVDIFEREHNLHMQAIAKETFAKNIETLVLHELSNRRM